MFSQAANGSTSGDGSVLPILAHQRQTKITDHFAIRGPPRPIYQVLFVPNRVPRVTFLDLPRSVREKIYEEANVGGGKFMDLNFWTIDEERWLDHNGEQLNWVPSVVKYPHNADHSHSSFSEESFPAALLWTGSRLIHQEVEAKLYAENTFAVSLLGLHGLRPLEMLSNAALREIRVLIVSLQPCKCHTPICSKIDWAYGQGGIWPRPRNDYFWRAFRLLAEQGTHSRPLNCAKRVDRLTISRWQRICSRLASNIRTDQLKLYLATELADLQTARVILDPLRSLPVLKDVAISLGAHLTDPESRSLVRKRGLKLMNKLHAPPFGFMKLPTELQIQILEHTNLKADCVLWDPAKRFRSVHFGKSCSGSHGTGFERSHCNFKVFCALEGGAAFSPHCECRTSQENYFMVSKAFGAIARSVSYASNEFRLMPHEWGNSGEIAGLVNHDGGNYYRLTLSSFLRRVPGEFVPSLRHLTLVFPPAAPTYMLPGQSEWAEWVQFVADLSKAADLSRLKLEVHFSDQDSLPYQYPADQNSFEYRSLRARLYRSPGLEKAMLETYVRILAPLQGQGSHLRALFIYIAWPLCKEAMRNVKQTRLCWSG